MFQKFTIVSIALLIGIAMTGCGRQETTQSQPSPEQPPTADVPVMVEPEDG